MMDPHAKEAQRTDAAVHACGRREFLAAAGATAAAIGIATFAAADSPAAKKPPAEKPMPQIRLGEHSIGRLICGGNPFNAGSHLSSFVNQEMRAYYTPEQNPQDLAAVPGGGDHLLADSGARNVELYRRLVDEGCRCG